MNIIIIYLFINICTINDIDAVIKNIFVFLVPKLKLKQGPVKGRLSQ